MSKWYVEYKVNKNGYWAWDGINGIEAKDGKEAIEYVKEHIAIGGAFFKAYHDDEEENL